METLTARTDKHPASVINGKFSLIRRLFEIFIIVIIMFLSNRRSWYCFFLLDDREYYCEYNNISTDFFWWGAIVVGVTLLIIQRGLIKEYLARWKANWPLVAFIAYEMLSLIWAVNVNRSNHTVNTMIAAPISAAGLATMYSREQIFRLLLWFIGFVALASLAAVIILPKTAITQIDYLAGRMSLVGPRPEMPYLVEKYQPWQRKRFAVPPGLTGWWQVNGRSDKPMHLHTEDDLYYIQNYSIWLDIQILGRTVWVVIVGNGAF